MSMTAVAVIASVSYGVGVYNRQDKVNAQIQTVNFATDRNNNLGTINPAAPEKTGPVESDAPNQANKQAPDTSLVENEILPDRFIALFKDTKSYQEALDRATRAGAKDISKFDALNGFAATLSSAAASELKSNPNLAAFEQDRMMKLDDPNSDVKTQGATQNVEEPNDPAKKEDASLKVTQPAASLWGLDRIDQRDLPLNTNYEYGWDGTNVTAYIIDTGIYSAHSEFGGRANLGVDFVGGANPGGDCHGHGTHVAGTIGGKTYGVAKNVKLVGVRVLNCGGSGSYSGVINGVNWTLSQYLAGGKKASVVNMSLGGGVSAALNTAVNSAVSSGLPFVVAAGNSNANACSFSPASAASAITVGASTNTDTRATAFSNWGSCVDIFAPGAGVTSAYIGNPTATATWNGTSMASPHVAGIAALMLQVTPSATPAQLTGNILASASANKLAAASLGAGSPNLLAYAYPSCVVNTADNTHNCQNMPGISFPVAPASNKAVAQVCIPQIKTISPSSPIVSTGGFSKIGYRVQYTSAPTGWSLNIGDSSSNDGWSGDYGTAPNNYNAEMEINGTSMNAYTQGGSPSVIWRVLGVANVVTAGSTITLTVSDSELNWATSTSLGSPGMVNVPNRLYGLAGQSDYCVFSGLNRVINTAGRSGSGVGNAMITLFP